MADLSWREWLVAGGTPTSRARRGLVVQVIASDQFAYRWVSEAEALRLLESGPSTLRVPADASESIGRAVESLRACGWSRSEARRRRRR